MEKGRYNMDQAIATQSQIIRFQGMCYVLFILFVTGACLVAEESFFAMGYWAVLLFFVFFISTRWLTTFVIPTIREWWQMDQKSTIKIIKNVSGATVLFSIMIHGFLFTNEFFSHDSITYISYVTPSSPTIWIATGRILIPVYEMIKGKIAAPWLIGVLYVIWMILANLLIVRFLRLSRKISIFLACGLLCANSSIILFAATYLTWLDNNAFAIFSSVAAAYLFCRCKYGAPLGILCTVISLSIYQPYFTITLVLCFFASIQNLLEGEKTIEVIRKGLKYIVFLCAGFLAYFVVWHILCKAFSVPMLRLEETGLSFDFTELIVEQAKNANWKYIYFLFNTDGSFGKLRPVVNFLLLMFLVIWVLKRLVNNALSSGSKVLLVVLVCLMPTVFNSIDILVPNADQSTITLSMIVWEFFYLFGLGFLGKENNCLKIKIQTQFRTAVLGLICIVIFQNTVFANQVYIKKELEKTSTLAVVTRIIDRIETTDGYIPGKTSVMFVGELSANQNIGYFRKEYYTYSNMTGLWSNFAATYNISSYLNQLLAYPLNIVNISDLAEGEAVQKMPIYPERNSIQFVDDILIVKLS